MVFFSGSVRVPCSELQRLGLLGFRAPSGRRRAGFWVWALVLVYGLGRLGFGILGASLGLKSKSTVLGLGFGIRTEGAWRGRLNSAVLVELWMRTALGDDFQYTRTEDDKWVQMTSIVPYDGSGV